MKIKISRSSQIAVNDLIDAIKRDGDVDYFKMALEKHIKKLEDAIASASVSTHQMKLKAAKVRRAHRADLESRETQINLWNGRK